ncbi:MAG: tetratricopeptide repeat protein, partial [Blastocatellia bacterium]
MFQPTILQAPRYGFFLKQLGAALLLAACLIHPTVRSQELQALEVGKPIERELAGGQAHSYQITLAAGQFLDTVVEQKGIDVVVTLFGPDGKKLIEVDSPNGAQGPEPIQWIAAEAGTYRLEVRSPEKEAGVGRYEVKIVELRAATETDRALMKALGLYNEAENLLRGGKYDEAIPLAERAFALREKALGPNHPDIANSLYNLALLYYAKGNYAKAETFHLRALGIREKALSPSHTDIANSLNNLAGLYYTKGDYAKAESLYQRALETLERAFGPNRPEVATSLNNLAWLYYSKGDYAKAETFHLRALEIRGKALGPNHSHVAISLNNLAELYHTKGDYAKAETFH